MYDQAVKIVCQGALDKEAGVYVANSRPGYMENALDSLKLYTHHSQAIFGSKFRKEVKMMSPEYELGTKLNKSVQIRAVVPRPIVGSVPTGVESRDDSRLTKLENQTELILAKLDTRGMLTQFSLQIRCALFSVLDNMWLNYLNICHLYVNYYMCPENNVFITQY
jgi:hypothetical protein